MMMTSPVVVIDNGTGMTKIGYASNAEPTHVMPTLCAVPPGSDESRGALASLSFSVGLEATERIHSTGWLPVHPVHRGIVKEWDSMERVWRHCFYKYLRVEPEDAGVVLAESVANPPDARMNTAEVFFEAFGVARLHIAPEGALALRSSWNSDADAGDDSVEECTGLVVDIGAGGTSITPIVNGFVLLQGVRHLPLGGQDITQYVLENIRARGEPLPPGEALAVARCVKEQHCHAALTSAEALEVLGSDRSLPVTPHRVVNSRTGVVHEVGVGRERLLAAELLFHPERLSSTRVASLPVAVDAAIWSCPIDCRRRLCSRVMLCGGTSLLPGVAERLQGDLLALITNRAAGYMHASGDPAWRTTYDVRVLTPGHRHHAVWHGGSLLGASAEFQSIAISKQEYEECGPFILQDRGAFNSTL